MSRFGAWAIRTCLLSWCLAVPVSRMSFGYVRASFFYIRYIMKTKDLIALPLEERAKQQPEKKKEMGCVFLGIFFILILSYIIIICSHTKELDISMITMMTILYGGLVLFGAYRSFHTFKDTQIKIIADAKREIAQNKDQELQRILDHRLVELSKKYGDDNSKSFVNGVLSCSLASSGDIYFKADNYKSLNGKVNASIPKFRAYLIVGDINK